jgi:multiple sugar transport system substrate-binding protein
MSLRNQWQLIVCSCLLFLVGLIGVGTSEPTKVVMMSRSDYDYPKFDEQMLELFHKENPDIIVERLGISSSEQRMKVYVAAGQQLDICVMDPYIVLSMARDGLAAPITEFVRREPRFESWYPPILDAYTFRGELYGLPRDLQLPGVFINVSAYQEAGLAVPRTHWTYEDVKNNAIKLQKADADGTITRWGWKLPTWRNWVPIIWGHGADFVDSWTDPTRFIGNTSQMHEALNFMHSLVESGAIPGQADHGRKSATAGFVDQTNAMVNTNTLAMPVFRSITSFEWDVAPAPYGPAGRKPYFNALAWVMLSTAQDKAATWKVLNFLTSEKAMTTMADLLGVVPPDRRYAQYWVRLHETPFNRAVLFDDLDSAGYPGTLELELYSILEAETLAATWGTKAVSAAIETMQQLANVRLRELADW